MSAYEAGKILNVDEITLGDALAEDAAAGATTVFVVDAADFDRGMTVYINGAPYTVAAVDDDEGALTINPALDAAAEEGDAVDVWDTLYDKASSYKVASVELFTADSNEDAIEATVAEHLAASLEEGVRGGSAETVLLMLDGGEWRVEDILGRPVEARGGGTLFWQDSHTVTEPVASWVKDSAPVLVGDGGAAEQNAIQEMMVLPDPTGQAQLRAWYTAGWLPASIRSATSNDAGRTWTKGTTNLIGQGAGGVTGDVGHTGLVVDGSALHIIFTDPASGNTTLRRVTSTDGGLTWGNPITILTKTGWESGRWGNSACVIRSGTWHLLYEAMDTSNVWQMGYATSSDGITFGRQNGGNPLTSLRYGTGMYGGPDLHLLDDGTWELFYHASTSGVLPTRIYRATSADLITWAKDPAAPILDMTLAFEVDQVADATVVTIGGERVMFYGGNDNPNATAKIGRATYTVAAGEQAFDLTHDPIDNSEHLYWNGLYQPASVWSRSGRTVTVPDAPGDLRVGDELVVEYAYRVGLKGGALPTVTVVVVSRESSASLRLFLDEAGGVANDLAATAGATTTLYGPTLSELTLRLVDDDMGLTASYPDAAHFRRSPISGTDSYGDYTGFRYEVEDWGGDGDYNDVVVDVRGY